MRGAVNREPEPHSPGGSLWYQAYNRPLQGWPGQAEQISAKAAEWLLGRSENDQITIAVPFGWAVAVNAVDSPSAIQSAG